MFGKIKQVSDGKWVRTSAITYPSAYVRVAIVDSLGECDAAKIESREQLDELIQELIRAGEAAFG